ncbi:hypothetical protein [Citrobacter freundii]
MRKITLSAGRTHQGQLTGRSPVFIIRAETPHYGELISGILLR